MKKDLSWVRVSKMFLLTYSFHTSEASPLGLSVESGIIVKWSWTGRNTSCNLKGSKVVFMDIPINPCFLPSSLINNYQVLCHKGKRKQYKESIAEGMFLSKLWTAKSENPEHFISSFHQTFFFIFSTSSSVETVHFKSIPMYFPIFTLSKEKDI